MLHEATRNSLMQVQCILDHFKDMPEADADDLFISSRCGAHMRHIYDHWLAAQYGLTQFDAASSEKPLVDYDQRNREGLVERSRQASERQLSEIVLWLENATLVDTPVLVQSESDVGSQQTELFHSTLKREWLYLINHTIHHVAHICLRLSHQGLKLPGHLGLAPSTSSYERSRAASVQ